jgi:amylosucrase
MYQFQQHRQLRQAMAFHTVALSRESDELFYARALANMATAHELFTLLYGHHPKKDDYFQQLLHVVIMAHANRPQNLRQRDWVKMQSEAAWFTSNELAGMSLYVDRFCGNLKALPEKLSYLENLGVNLLHLMPLFQSPEGESDGGYAVSDFRKVDPRFGSLEELKTVRQKMETDEMYLMLDIVFNHTSHFHEWAIKAKAGHQAYQDFFYMYDDRFVPDQFEQNMPEIFPEAAPGNFTWVPECNKWVMTVFHHYQWDLNYTNPAVFVAMLDTVFFYANLGVDILRIDAPAFIWKQIGTTCQNLPQAHTILQLLRQCVQMASPGMALLGEAIVAPHQIMQYFGEGKARGKECDFAYNATQMALQWDALATGDTRVMLSAQDVLLQKPLNTSWITYTRSHDDIGLGYEDYMIETAGFSPYHHRKFLQEYYSGAYPGTPAKGALFSVNTKTGDARISGTLASLCGLEKAMEENDVSAIDLSIQKILLMQALSFFVGGMPMLFYGDEVGYTNDYTYLEDESKSYDNRWIHRPIIDWNKNQRHAVKGTIECRLYLATKRLLDIRKKMPVVADLNNHQWSSLHNSHVAGFVRRKEGEKPLVCLFNFSGQHVSLPWQKIEESTAKETIYDHWTDKHLKPNESNELILVPYGFYLLQDL